MPTFEARVQISLDDGTWQNSDLPTKVIHGSGTGVHGSGSGAGDGFNVSMHWGNVTIPNGATIDVAFLRFKAQVADSANTVRLNCFGIDEDNPVAPVDVADATAKALTAAVAWDNLPAWSLDEEGPDTTTPSLVAQVQTIVNRPGWASGNAMEFQVKDDGTDLSNIFRRSYTVGMGGNTQSALVHIEYTEPPSPAGQAVPGHTSWGIGRQVEMLPY